MSKIELLCKQCKETIDAHAIMNWEDEIFYLCVKPNAVSPKWVYADIETNLEALARIYEEENKTSL